MANGFIDGVGYPMNGGLAAGFAYGQKMAEEKRRRGLASGFTQYMNAQDDAGKRAARSQIAQYDPNTAFNLMKYEQELANKDKMTPYQTEQLAIQRQQLANNGRMNEYQTWQKEEVLRKEQEAKEKEKLLGDALYRYQTAQTDEDKNVALADVYRASPDFAKDILKKQKEDEKKGYGNSELGLMIDVQMHPENYSPEVVQYVKDYGRVKTKDPSIRGMNEYEGAVGKQYAEAGLPYGNGTPKQMTPQVASVGEVQSPQTQAMPMQAQPIPTAAQLKAAEKEAVKLAENRIDRENTDADLERKKPVLKEALRKALIAARSGKGSGVVEGQLTRFGLNPNAWFDKKYSQNYGDIENAGRLINQYVRQSLKNAGLTGKELDSAAEANRYLYELNPTNNEQIIESRIINFINDYMPELLEEEGFVTNQNSTNNAYKEKYGLE